MSGLTAPENPYAIVAAKARTAAVVVKNVDHVALLAWEDVGDLRWAALAVLVQLEDAVPYLKFVRSLLGDTLVAAAHRTQLLE
jgi:hypothetical protein